MKTLKQLIQQWRNTTQANTGYLRHSIKRHDILLLKTELRLEMCLIKETMMPEEDKERMYDLYDAKIEALSSELFWLDTLYDLNINIS